ncbi:hypothetical protein F385_52 [Pantoea agglomerans 299R]|nr:hypothetical protein F385_52 [Pantoea agglomerans 299R]
MKSFYYIFIASLFIIKQFRYDFILLIIMNIYLLWDVKIAFNPWLFQVKSKAE